LKTPDDFSAAQNDDGEYLTDSSGLSLDSTYFDRSYLTDSSGLSLDSTYFDRSVSDILRIMDEKLFSQEFYDSVIDENEYWEYFLRANKDFTKLRKYTSEQHYQPHQDIYK
jgi:hypothetical protein